MKQEIEFELRSARIEPVLFPKKDAEKYEVQIHLMEKDWISKKNGYAEKTIKGKVFTIDDAIKVIKKTIDNE